MLAQIRQAFGEGATDLKDTEHAWTDKKRSNRFIHIDFQAL